jgi:plasmid maintenance system antidote protein VapI
VDTHGRSPESWLAMQRQHDLWFARKGVKLDTVRPVRFDGPGDGGQPAV